MRWDNMDLERGKGAEREGKEGVGEGIRGRWGGEGRGYGIIRTGGQI